MREQDERVPVEVEEYFVGIYAGAGELGSEIGAEISGMINGGIARRSHAGRGGARGAVWAARKLKTTVEERAGVLPGTPDQLRQRVYDAFTGLQTLRNEPNLWRITISVGLSGMQQVVVDLSLAPSSQFQLATDVRLLAFCKQGLLRANFAKQIADRMWAALA